MNVDRSDRLEALFYQMMRLHRSAMHARMADEGAFVGQPHILFELAKNHSMNQTELAQALHLSPATITITLSRMAKAGLIRREGDMEDRRVQNVFVTEKGVELLNKTQAASQRMIRETFCGVPDDDMEVVLRVMEKIVENLKSMSARCVVGADVPQIP